MLKSSYFPQRIYIEEESLDSPLTRKILEKSDRIPKEIIRNPQEIIQELHDSKDWIGEGKKYLLLTKQRGNFVKPCPCTLRYIGCNYFIINLVFNCPLDCTYCILQDYLSHPLITVFVNLEDLWRELDVFLQKREGKYLRIGTGELGDSLVLDHLTENSKDLISYFREKERAVLELKTKTVEINNILEIKPADNVVISWSLNTFKIAEEEEKRAPRVEERMKAALRVSEKGFKLGFHFDPLIRYSGWEEEYAEVIRILLNTVDPHRISWISLGSLRFPPSLKPLIKKRFPRIKIIYDEFIKGKDGKLRYFRPLRLELYQKIVNFIKGYGGEKIPLYFCMESEEVWKKVMDWVPGGKEDVESFLSPWGNQLDF
jgi:spore photoproduct lyase